MNGVRTNRPCWKQVFYIGVKTDTFGLDLFIVFCFLKPTMDSCIRIASLHDKEGQAKCQTQVFPAIGNYLVSEDF
jgi:hypothetical protein